MVAVSKAVAPMSATIGATVVAKSYPKPRGFPNIAASSLRPASDFWWSIKYSAEDSLLKATAPMLWIIPMTASPRDDLTPSITFSAES